MNEFNPLGREVSPDQHRMTVAWLKAVATSDVRTLDHLATTEDLKEVATDLGTMVLMCARHLGREPTSFVDGLFELMDHGDRQ